MDEKVKNPVIRREGRDSVQVQSLQFSSSGAFFAAFALLIFFTTLLFVLLALYRYNGHRKTDCGACYFFTSLVVFHGGQGLNEADIGRRTATGVTVELGVFGCIGGQYAGVSLCSTGVVHAVTIKAVGGIIIGV